MKEYALIVDADETLNEERYYLLPVGLSPDYALLFKTKAKAHEYKLALGMGTYPTRKNSPENYSLLETKFNGLSVYEITVERDNGADLQAPKCCKSGCDGCPWTLEQIRKGLL